MLTPYELRERAPLPPAAAVAKSTQQAAAEAAVRDVCLAEEGSFPHSALQQLTSLDKPQLKAVEAVMSRELVLVQGPPGTGKVREGKGGGGVRRKRRN